ncbi:MAG: exodeoxyribonuclease VII large subunit [Chloroflexi bacterium]|nr:exodeoxyribonuclease VII large subunit [Chloroflexota bacterium]
MTEDLIQQLLEDFWRPPVWRVGDVLTLVRGLIQEQAELQDLWVQGEVSHVSQPRSGHLYFTLVDEDGRAVLPCVMWRPRVLRQSRIYLPQPGDHVEVHGYLDLYPRGGKYQLYADVIRPVGQGAAYQAFLRLKARLEAEGLFDEERKRPIPRFPRRIGVVTSATGAALRDILNTIRRRYPLAEVVLAASFVQGDEAPESLVAALEALNRVAQPDVIILARGGGAVEDLAAFNDERVVRAVAASQAPVITGVGHETDFTLVDFAADRRAPTPTGAAELATPDQAALRDMLAHLRARMARALERHLLTAATQLAYLERRLQRHHPQTRLQAHRLRLEQWRVRLRQALRHHLILARERCHHVQQALPRAMDQQLSRARARLQDLRYRLRALDPLAPLQRGYALLFDEQGRLIRHARDVVPGQRLTARLGQGRLTLRVEQRHIPSGEDRREP